MASANFEFVTHNSIKHLPLFAVGQLNSKAATFTIQPILPSDMNDLDAFYGAQKIDLNDRMKDVFANAVTNNPLSVYVVRSQKNAVSGLLIFYPDAEKGELRLGVYVDKSLRRQQVGTAIWSWAVEQLFPLLVENRFHLGKNPLPDVVLVLKNVPEYLHKKAADFGFAYDEANKVHSIVMGKFLKKPPEVKKGWFPWS